MVCFLERKQGKETASRACSNASASLVESKDLPLDECVVPYVCCAESSQWAMVVTQNVCFDEGRDYRCMTVSFTGRSGS